MLGREPELELELAGEDHIASVGRGALRREGCDEDKEGLIRSACLLV
jgi:hypothetical protein